jgi:hypothetical protein
VDAERLVRGHRAVDEAEAGTARVLLTELAERLLALPPFEHLQLETRVVGHARKRLENLRHQPILATGNIGSPSGVSSIRDVRYKGD